MTLLRGRLDRLERAHPQRGLPHPSDGDGALTAQRVIDGARVEDLTDQALLTMLEYCNKGDRQYGDGEFLPMSLPEMLLGRV